uniref:Uncharacterized protein n=1 Tax=Neovison vison TaxID=452646 RepID=A0A8C7B051_NEOVI
MGKQRHPSTVNLTMFFNMAMNGEPLVWVSFQLFADRVPKTADNFSALNTGSIYGEKFVDENFISGHLGGSVG